MAFVALARAGAGAGRRAWASASALAMMVAIAMATFSVTAVLAVLVLDVVCFESICETTTATERHAEVFLLTALGVDGRRVDFWRVFNVLVGVLAFGVFTGTVGSSACGCLCLSLLCS
jgi:hypothetical protein